MLFLRMLIALYNAGDLQSCLEFHERAWLMYPEPRNNRNEAYNTAKYAVDDCFCALDETFAQRLVCILFVNSLYNRKLFRIFEH